MIPLNTVILPNSSCILQKRFEEAVTVLKMIYPTGEGKAEFDEVASAKSEWQKEGTQAKSPKFWDILVTKERRMALIAGVGIQVGGPLTLITKNHKAIDIQSNGVPSCYGTVINQALMRHA